ncbi:MAG TPA: hypothetical protein VE547_07635, partial [Mycobacteriales bacterium]|nr:hypothetical protein [Mycobacteriales bacterium]
MVQGDLTAPPLLLVVDGAPEIGDALTRHAERRGRQPVLVDPTLLDEGPDLPAGDVVLGTGLGDLRGVPPWRLIFQVAVTAARL